MGGIEFAIAVCDLFKESQRTLEFLVNAIVKNSNAIHSPLKLSKEFLLYLTSPLSREVVSLVLEHGDSRHCCWEEN